MGYRRAPGIDLSEYAGVARFKKETGGIVLNGMSVATDRQSQAMLTGAYSYVLQNPDATIQWKADGGFVTLDAAAVTAIANAVGAHVQACFAKESEVVAGIESGEIEDTAAIDSAFAEIA